LQSMIVAIAFPFYQLQEPKIAERRIPASHAVRQKL
jgi:hypothetical protein